PDFEPLRRQCPDRRPPLGPSKSEVTSQKSSLAPDPSCQLSQPSRGPRLAPSRKHQSFDLFSCQIPTHCQEPTQLPIPVCQLPVPPRLPDFHHRFHHPSPIQTVPGPPIQSLGVGGREGAKAAARLSSRARCDSPTC